MANRWGKNGNCDILFYWVPKSLQIVTAAMKLKYSTPWKKVKTNIKRVLKSRDITLPTKIHIVKAMVFPVWKMYGCESWTIKKAGAKELTHLTVLLEKTLERLLHCKEIKPVKPKEKQP